MTDTIPSASPRLDPDLAAICAGPPRHIGRMLLSDILAAAQRGPVDLALYPLAFIDDSAPRAPDPLGVALEAIRGGRAYAPLKGGRVLCVVPVTVAIDAILAETTGAEATRAAIVESTVGAMKTIADIMIANDIGTKPHPLPRFTLPVVEAVEGEGMTEGEAVELAELCAEMATEGPRMVAGGEPYHAETNAGRWRLALLPGSQFFGLYSPNDAERMRDAVEHVCARLDPGDGLALAMMREAFTWLSARLAGMGPDPESLARAVDIALDAANDDDCDDCEALDVAELARTAAAGGAIAAMHYAMRFLPASAQTGPRAAAIAKTSTAAGLPPSELGHLVDAYIDGDLERLAAIVAKRGAAAPPTRRLRRRRPRHRLRSTDPTPAG